MYRKSEHLQQEKFPSFKESKPDHKGPELLFAKF